MSKSIKGLRQDRDITVFCVQLKAAFNIFWSLMKKKEHVKPDFLVSEIDLGIFCPLPFLTAVKESASTDLQTKREHVQCEPQQKLRIFYQVHTFSFRVTEKNKNVWNFYPVTEVWTTLSLLLIGSSGFINLSPCPQIAF